MPGGRVDARDGVALGIAVSTAEGSDKGWGQAGAGVKDGVEAEQQVQAHLCVDPGQRQLSGGAALLVGQHLQPFHEPVVLRKHQQCLS